MQNFVFEDPLPSWLMDALQEEVSTGTGNVLLRVFNSTTIEVPAGTGSAQAGLSIDGFWRYNTATVQRAHPGGAAGAYDVFVTASNNNIVNTPHPGTDLTNYAFGLDIKTAGSTPTIVPGTVDRYRLIGQLTWDGSAITDLRPAVDSVRATDPLRPTATLDTTVPLEVLGKSTSHTADLLRLRKNAAGTVQFSVSNVGAVTALGGATFGGALQVTGGGTFTGGIVNASAYQVSGSALAASNLSNGVTGSGAIVLAASPALSGVPTAPTASGGTNTAQIATTAFVTAAVTAGGSPDATTLVKGIIQLAGDLTGTAALPTIKSSVALSGVPTAATAAVDTNTTQLATTAYVIGQGYLKSATAASTYAPLASPALTGTPTAPTASPATSTTQLATTAFVTTADNLKANLASPTFTGTPAGPTAAVDTNTAQLATTAYVIGQGYAKLASPALTGTPTAPTAAVDTSTTQLATTAYVIGQGYAKLTSNRLLTNIANATLVREVGEAGIKAGRVLSNTADFQVLFAGQNPIGLWGLTNINDGSGNAYNLTNKGTVSFTTGIRGNTEAAQFTGSTAQALYISSASNATAEAALRIATGSWGCWFRTAKRATTQYLVTKWGASPQLAYGLGILGSNFATMFVSQNGSTTPVNFGGTIDVADDRWHFAVCTFDGSRGCLYVDGVLDGSQSVPEGTIFAGTSPFNIGGSAADAGTATSIPHYGRIDEAFVTDFVLSEAQVRYLYAASISHSLGVVPVHASLALTPAIRGVSITVNDFPTPASATRIYNIYGPGGSQLQDTGQANVPVTATGGSLSLVSGPNGGGREAFLFNGSGALQATDTGLPATTASRTYGAWFRTTSNNIGLMGWGTFGSADSRLVMSTTGVMQAVNGGDIITPPNPSNDGRWHCAIVTEDNAPADGTGIKRRFYLDGRLVGSSTTLNSITLVGANNFRVGSNPGGTNTWVGTISRAFVYAGVLSAEQVRKVYNGNQSSSFMPTTPKNAGDHIEALEAGRILVVFDKLEGADAVSIELAA